ncbi:hypothetical protein DOT66_25220 [Ralstonia pseudosolanacearum]|uniref:hypothetical protein n=1 Tax=Ralstonia pseudosolanacearum TaxID=1310165 RepID=UPI000DAE2AC8|nr:hypothetical protein [Ralstonia pseudosolanacearum]AZU59633.1 hypothetical protein CFM90_23135 [Ralstonia solanacearum]MCK4140211.1 hypothetical protein [Ralstonia pseudosolanacearum]QVX41841.1 hypothetical protein J4H89_21065 [Ralstonia solanacearum]RAA04443.1 hypothetical protein DOT66_25220 [Ralstonia pseudosolanacearum]UQY85657.1 hypothetical protein JNO62_21090 [Ralstonia pseudosolanacearum]
MSSLSIFVHPTGPERKIKLGFCWVALFFGTFWAYSEGLIAHGGRLTAVDGVAGLLCLYGEQCGHPSAFGIALLLVIAKNIYCALRGQYWLQNLLIDQGYRVIRVNPDNHR